MFKVFKGIKKAPEPLFSKAWGSEPGGIRTHDLLIRSQIPHGLATLDTQQSQSTDSELEPRFEPFACFLHPFYNRKPVTFFHPCKAGLNLCMER